MASLEAVDRVIASVATGAAFVLAKAASTFLDEQLPVPGAVAIQVVIVVVLAEGLRLAGAEALSRLPRLRRLISGRQHFEGTWVDVGLDFDGNVQYGLLHIQYSGRRLVVSGENFDSNLLSVGSFSSDSVSVTWPTVRFFCRTSAPETPALFSEAHAQITFLGEDPPARYTLWAVDSASGRRLRADGWRVAGAGVTVAPMREDGRAALIRALDSRPPSLRNTD